MKSTYDMRGRQGNIARLWPFYKEGFVHMLFYRVLMFFAIVYGVALLLSLIYPQLLFTAKVLTIAMWILFTPQLFETLKGFAMISSGGMVFGHLSNEYMHIMKEKYKKGRSPLYLALPYAAMLAWAAGFVAMLLWWNI